MVRQESWEQRINSERSIMSAKKILIVVGVIVGLLVIAGIVVAFMGGGSSAQEPQATPTGAVVIEGAGGGGGDVSLPVVVPDVSAQVVPEAATWACVAINSPDWSTYNPSLPMVYNAFRAIQLAGNPQVWENGPYMYVDTVGVSRVVATWSELSLVYNGDQVCVH